MLTIMMKMKPLSTWLTLRVFRSHLTIAEEDSAEMPEIIGEFSDIQL